MTQLPSNMGYYLYDINFKQPITDIQVAHWDHPFQMMSSISRQVSDNGDEVIMMYCVPV